MAALLADSTSTPEIPLDDWVTSAVNWLLRNLTGLFDFVRTVLKYLVEHVTDGLNNVPTYVMVAVLTVIALLLTRWTVALFTLIGFMLIDSMRLWEHAMQTLGLVIVASVIAIVIAVPLGIAASRFRTVSVAVKPVLDFMQTMPVFIYLIPAVFFFGLGYVPGVIATVVFAMPPGVRFTELGIRQVDSEIVEAGEAFGAPPRRILSGIQLPLALPTIMAGINQVIMLSLSMVVVAGMVGAPGLGQDVVGALSRQDIGFGFEAGLAVVIVAIFLDRLTASFAPDGNRDNIIRPVVAFLKRALSFLNPLLERLSPRKVAQSD